MKHHNPRTTLLPRVDHSKGAALAEVAVRGPGGVPAGGGARGGAAQGGGAQIRGGDAAGGGEAAAGGGGRGLEREPLQGLPPLRQGRVQGRRLQREWGGERVLWFYGCCCCFVFFGGGSSVSLIRFD